MEGFGETVILILMDGCPSDNAKRLQLVEYVDFEQLSGNSEEKVIYVMSIVKYVAIYTNNNNNNLCYLFIYFKQIVVIV